MSTNRISLIAWLVSLLGVIVFSAMSWRTVVLTPEAGSQEIELNGFSALPLLGVLALLQFLIFIVSFLVSQLVGKVLYALLGGFASLMAFQVWLSGESAANQTASERISSLTGISGSQAQEAIIAQSSMSWAIATVAILLAINALALVIRTFSEKSSFAQNRVDSPEDELWQE